MGCHVILMDFGNTGEMFRLTIEGIKEDILAFLYSFSEDVRYVKEARSHKNDRGVNQLPCGIVKNCVWECTKSDVMSKYKSRYFDARKVVLP